MIPAADPASALVAAQFAAHAETYQATSTHAAAIHQQLVNALAVSSESHASTEAATT